QDKWHMRDVTLNLGVRYDLEDAGSSLDAFNPMFASPAVGHPVDKNNISPRLGFTWTPKGSTTSVIRGGYGMYYDKITMQTITPFVSQAVYSSSFVAQFPNSAADPGPSRGQLPTDPLLQSFACGPNAGAGA